jgi:GTP-binding protein
MKRPFIALVGRSNVGKSALFNRLCQKRIAIVDEEEGVTRDRIYQEIELFGKEGTLIDTAGLFASNNDFKKEVSEQTQMAINEADVIILVVDGKVGIMEQDQKIAKILLQNKKNVVVAVNKIDDPQQENHLYDFLSLGFKKIHAVSAQTGYQAVELLEEAFSLVKNNAKEEEKQYFAKVAIVGRPNVGKSSLLNGIVEEERLVVSPIAGTTRDAVDVVVQREDKNYLFIDTAGIKRKPKEKTVIEKFSSIRTKMAIDKADICVVVLDVQSGITTQEKHIIERIEEKKKGCILVLNKWDLVKGFRQETCKRALFEEIPFLEHCPLVFISAKFRKNIQKLFPLLQEVMQEMQKRVTTGKLNSFIEKCMQEYHPPMLQGKRLRIYYMTQVQTNPPRFVLFVNNPHLFMDTYERYLIGRFRKEFGFMGCPITFHVRARTETEEFSEKNL